MNRKQFVLLAVSFILVLHHGVLLDAREWVDVSGKYRTEAELVSVRNGKVYLETSSGKLITVPLKQLSKRDLRYLVALPQWKEYFKKHPVAGLDDSRTQEQSSASSGGVSSSSQPINKQAAKPAKPLIPGYDESYTGEVRRFGDLGWGVASLAFSADGRFLVVGKKDRAIIVYDVANNQKIVTQSDLDDLGSITCLAFSASGDKLLSGGATGLIKIWDVAPNGLISPIGKFAGHSGDIKTMTISRDEKYVLSGGDDKKAYCWTLADGRPQFVVDGFKRPVQATFITRGGKQSLASDGSQVMLIDMKEGQVIERMELGRGISQTTTIAPNGSLIVVNNLYALHGKELKTGEGPLVFQDREIQWFSIFLPDSRYLLSGGNGKVNLWNAKTRVKAHVFDIENSTYIKCVAVSPDGRHFAAAGSRAVAIFRLPKEARFK